MIALGAELAVVAISMVLVAVKSAAPNQSAAASHNIEPDALGALSDEDLLRRAAMLNDQTPKMETPSAPVVSRKPSMQARRPAFGKR